MLGIHFGGDAAAQDHSLVEPAGPRGKDLGEDLLDLVEGEFEPATWQAFRRLALDGRRAAEVAAELGTTVNAVFLAKSRVLKQLWAEVQELADDTAIFQGLTG